MGEKLLNKYIVLPIGVLEYQYDNNLIMDHKEPFNLGVKIDGVLSHHKSPLLNVKINGVWYNGVIDTGAVKTHLAPSFIQNIKDEPLKSRKGMYQVGTSECDSFDLDYKLGDCDHIFKDVFVELPHFFPYQIIFGTEFLNRCESLHIYLREKRFELFL